MSHHVTGLRVYLTIFLALMVLTALTVYVAFIDMGPLNNFVAMGIAAAKATLVILYFMHVRHSTRLTKLVIWSSLFFFALLIAVVIADVFTRGWLVLPGREMG